MTRTRVFLLVQGASFICAALVHLGVLAEGYQHTKAAIAETVIGSVLLAGLALTSLAPARARTIGLLVQAFALLGTFVGLFTIAIGVGPRTVPDLAYHASIVAALVAGLVATARAEPVA